MQTLLLLLVRLHGSHHHRLMQQTGELVRMRPVIASPSLLVLLVFFVHFLFDDSAAVPHAGQPPQTSFIATRNDAHNRTQGVTKVQMEDLDESSTGCVRLLELDFCRGDNSGTARFPNALGHTSEAETKAFVKDFVALLSDQSCGHSLRPFLCAALTPTCAAGGDDSPAALPPCRSICSAALVGCERALLGRGIQWPSEWSCDRFPKDGVCIDWSFRSTEGSDRAPSYRGRSPSDAYSIQSRGSLEPPPSSAVDKELMALQKDVSRRPETRRRMNGRRFPLNQATGDPRFFRGWVDVQGTGRQSDYCRILGTDPKERFLSCALNGTGSGYAYISKRGFDVGHPGTWFMRDTDADGRDDYCRCVGGGDSQMICMKAGEKGFYGGMLQPGSEYTFRLPESSEFTISCRWQSDALDIRRRTKSWRPHSDQMH